jgi:pimeloyl-[acyl-carrier protein] methyl ester esterase
MSLHVEVAGCGEPLVMLHGWGMHGGVWHEVVADLAESFELHVVDLPGHGASQQAGALELDAVVDGLAALFPQPVNVLGWSLGGIIAQHWAAREPEKVRRLVLVASTPCFAARPGWDCGMPQETLARFAVELEDNHAATLRRFLALQLRGSENERELLSVLRERLFSRGEPEMAALRGGLGILRDADLRGALPRIGQPTLAIAGERDRLTPPEASRYLAQAMPSARAVVVAGAAHAPFLSHPAIFVEQVKSFLHE